MSALADRARTGSRPPAYLPLALSTLPAQIVTGVSLWLVQLPFALLGVGPTSLGANVWLPWGADGVWSALGLAAYVLIACVLGGTMIGTRLAYRGILRPAPAWRWLAFGASGYGAMVLGDSGSARLLLAIVLAPLTLRLFGYRVDGTVRGWPARLSYGRRGVTVAMLLAVALAFSFSATHAFAQNGFAGSPSVALSPGQTTVIDIGLQGIPLPARLTGVQLDGSRTGRVAVVRPAVAGEQAPAAARSTRSASPGPVARALPNGIPARAGTWLAVGVRLLSCATRSTWVDALTLHYRVLGIATSERIPLWNPVRVACRGASVPSPAPTPRGGLSD